MGYGQFAPQWGRTTMRDSFAENPVPDIDGKPKCLQRSTFQYKKQDGSIVIRLHKTDILIQHPDGTQTLTTGGWKTVTTKDRLSHYVRDASIYADRGIWYVVEHGSGRKVPFYDGMILPHAFSFQPDLSQQKATMKQINLFCKKVGEGHYDPPNGGDCWFCLMEQGGQDAGIDHIQSHLDEGYVHGTLVINALRFAGYKDHQLPFVFKFADAPKRAMRRYLKRRFGLG